LLQTILRRSDSIQISMLQFRSNSPVYDSLSPPCSPQSISSRSLNKREASLQCFHESSESEGGIHNHVQGPNS
jgi:hypothetical protein